MSEGKNLWMAVGQLHHARRDLIDQLAEVTRDPNQNKACSFCGEGPPSAQVIVGSEAAICARCVALCGEILDVANRG